MKKKKQIKKERSKGITLIALVITIIVLLILAGVSIATLTGENGILTQAAKAREKTQEANKKEEEDINEMVYKMSGEDTSNANYPVVKEGMQKVYWKEDGTEVKEGEEGFEISKWYNYKEQKGRTDKYDEKTQEWGSSHWANVILDGNYYVWIPRYAYKIDKSVEYASQQGKSYKIDVKFIDKNTTSVEGYIVHPAFTFGEQQLEGIWVGKYETSNDGSGNAKIIPNVTSWREINVATMFDKAKKLSKTNIDAHILKNIEWGAVSYLAQSQYGRNGTDVSINQCSDYYTGAGRGMDTDNPIWNSTYSIEESTKLPPSDQQYKGKIGKLSSTTGNIYGIYDMSGGASEFVMGFYGAEKDNPTLGSTGFSNPPERKYYDLYTNDTVDESNIGDALYETKGWNSDGSNFVNSESPVFRRGGFYNSTSDGGIFCFYYSNGSANSKYGFHVCLAVK